MTIANLCILAACVLPVACSMLARAKGKSLPDSGGPMAAFDNHNPRGFMAQLTGWRARANAAQANSFEALPLFIAGVLAAQQTHAAQGRIDLLALGFIAARLVYIGLYVGNQATLRSLVWGIGAACCVAMFFLG